MSKKSLRYQVLSPEYVESAIQLSILAKISPENTFAAFEIPIEFSEQSVRSYFASDAAYKFSIIAIDESDGNKVVGVVQGRDFMDFEKDFKSSCEHPHIRVRTLSNLYLRFTKEIRSLVKQYGECAHSSTMYILPKYRSKGVRYELFKLQLLKFYETGYKQFIGFLYNPNMYEYANQFSFTIVHELKPEECLDLDPNIKEYFTKRYICGIYFLDDTASLAQKFIKKNRNLLDDLKPSL